MSDFKKKWGYRVAVVSLVVSIMAINKAFDLSSETGSMGFLYVIFCIFGLAGSLLVLFRRFGGKLLLLLFYAMQLIFILRPTWQYKITPSFSFPFYILNGSDPTVIMQKPVGYGINLFALLMLFFTIFWVQEVGRRKKVVDS